MKRQPSDSSGLRPQRTPQRARPGRGGLRLLARVGLAGLAVWIFLPGFAAEAGFVDRVKDIYGMPEQLGRLQQQYDQTQEALEASQAQLEETLKRSEEAARRYEETQAKLLQENEQLRASNDRLEQAIGQLETAKQEQETRGRQIATTAMTAGGLVLLYFVLMRVVRLAVWRRSG